MEKYAWKAKIVDGTIDEYIKRHDRGWYDCLAVQYKSSRKKYWLVKIEYHT